MYHFLIFILLGIVLYEINKIIKKPTQPSNYEDFKMLDNLEGGYINQPNALLPSNWNNNLEFHLNPTLHDLKKRFIDANSIKPYNIDLENDGVLTFSKEKPYPKPKERSADWKCQRPWMECAYYPPHLNKISSAYTLGDQNVFSEKV